MRANEKKREEEEKRLKEFLDKEASQREQSLKDLMANFEAQ